MGDDEQCSPQTTSPYGLERGYDNAKSYAGKQGVNYPGNRIRRKGEEAREALQCVLSAVQCHVSIEALERAVATVKAHLEADA